MIRAIFAVNFRVTLTADVSNALFAAVNVRCAISTNVLAVSDSYSLRLDTNNFARFAFHIVLL